VKWASVSESASYGENLKIFPSLILKILPAGILMTLLSGILSGCHASTSSVEASTTRNPVVAPAGTVLRVRLDQTLETGRSRPGDRFSGTLDAPVISGRLEVLPKGTKVEGHIEGKPGSHGTVLALALDCYQREGDWYAVSTNVVTRTGSPRRGGIGLQDVSAGTAIGGAAAAVSVPADSIIGFTLTKTLTA
jgi:hypothetical protein